VGRAPQLIWRTHNGCWLLKNHSLNTFFRVFSGRAPVGPKGQRPLVGSFDLLQSRIDGWVTDPDGPERRNIQVSILRKKRGGDILIGETSIYNVNRHIPLKFEIEVGSAVSGADLVAEVVEVKAVNSDGTVGLLRRNYLGNGFSYAEERLTWTVGLQSEILLPAPQEDGDYMLRMLVQPFVNPPLPRSQMLKIYIGDHQLGGVELEKPHQRFVEYRVPSFLFVGQPSFRLRFEHPDAIAPNEVGGKDKRPIGVGFRRLSLVRFSKVQ
jgi:hypothetical protein